MRMQQFMVLGLVFLAAGSLSAAVVTFDDLPQPFGGTLSNGSNVPAGYGGIDWEWNGSAGPRYMSELDRPAYGQPFSGTQYMYNFAGDALTEPIAFAFQDTDARLTGAYFNRAAQDQVNPIQRVRFVGYNSLDVEIASSVWLTLTNTPQWLPAGAGFQQADVVRIAIDRDMTEYGKFGMDDLAYDIVPEPATLALLALGGLGLFRKSRKH